MRSTPSSSLYTLLSRHLSSLPNFGKIPKRQRPKVVLQAQQTLTDYLHTTRSLSFTYAEHITKNSLFSLSNLIPKLDASPSNIPNELLRFLRYHPVNEFEFFFESIGIPFEEIARFLPNTEFFLSENRTILDVAKALSAFGFPWNKLGILYKEEVSIFGKDSEALSSKLCEFVSLGFDSTTVVGICLCFPFVLTGNEDLGVKVDALFDVLKRVFLDYDFKSTVEGNVDVSYPFCRKIKVFIDLGCCEKVVGELIGKNGNVFLECSEEVLVQKVEYFRRFNVRSEDVGLLLLRCPEILGYDLESPILSVMSFLKQFGLSFEELDAIALDYPHVFGKNRLGNLPHLIRALDLHEWLFDKIVNGNHHLLATFEIGSLDENLENDYKICVENLRSKMAHRHAIGKLNFLLGIGFGENLITMKVVSNLHGTASELQERFSYLLHKGIHFSNLCKMVKTLPKILNQCPNVVKDKIDFLCNEIGGSLFDLDDFPGYLCFDLENRTKPRYRMHRWLKENGYSKRKYTPASIIATSENNFIARLISIHPTLLKQWLERFKSKNHYYSCKM